MNEVLSIVRSIVIGFALGVMFFGGLWWTVKKGLGINRTGIWFLGSFLLRSSITMVGFYFVGKGNWQWMIACLIGFILARVIISLMTHQKMKTHSHMIQEVNHEPKS